MQVGGWWSDCLSSSVGNERKERESVGEWEWEKGRKKYVEEEEGMCRRAEDEVKKKMMMMEEEEEKMMEKTEM